MSHPLILLLIVIAILVIAALVFWPQGLISRWRAAGKRKRRVHIEDLLKHIHKCEMRGSKPTVESMAGAVGCSADQVVSLLEEMQEHQFVQLTRGECHLTGAGRSYALHIIRAHRLWEKFLADQTGVQETEWHRRAETQEHDLSRNEVESLSARLHHPLFDPHGDPIPTPSGKVMAGKGLPLTEAPVDVAVRITHVEDEPEVVYSQLVAEGFQVGMLGRITEAGPNRICFWTEGEEHYLSPLVARNLTVATLNRGDEAEHKDHLRLSDLQVGEKATISGVARSCRGSERRRFMDLGILPGTVVEVELADAANHLKGYRIRDTVIALRKEQAHSIYVNNLVRKAS